MRICSHCGAAAPDTNRFCRYDGANLEGAPFGSSDETQDLPTAPTETDEIEGTGAPMRVRLLLAAAAAFMIGAVLGIPALSARQTASASEPEHTEAPAPQAPSEPETPSKPPIALVEALPPAPAPAPEAPSKPAPPAPKPDAKPATKPAAKPAASKPAASKSERPSKRASTPKSSSDDDDREAKKESKKKPKCPDDFEESSKKNKRDRNSEKGIQSSVIYF